MTGKFQFSRFGLAILACAGVSFAFPAAFTEWGGVKLTKLVTPAIQVIMFGMGTTLTLADFVRNSINHPCVIISGFLNEPHSGLPECKSLVDRLVDVVHAEDTGHLVTFACNHTSKDISHAKTDIIAYNTYPCWYNDELETGSP